MASETVWHGQWDDFWMTHEWTGRTAPSWRVVTTLSTAPCGRPFERAEAKLRAVSAVAR